jgi:hypothetical protein
MAEEQQIDLPEKQQTWAVFTRLAQWACGLSVVTLALMAIFLL